MGWLGLMVENGGIRNEGEEIVGGNLGWNG